MPDLLAGTQDMGKGLTVIAAPLPLGVAVSLVDGTVEWQPVEMGPNDKHQSVKCVRIPWNMKWLLVPQFEVTSKTLPWLGFTFRSLMHFVCTLSFKNLSR